MHAILVTVGTDGDVFPYAGLGAALRARGHRVTLVTNEQPRALAASLDLGFRPLLSEEEARVPLADPDFWHPIKGGAIAARWVTPFIDRQYALLDELSRDGDAVLVASPGVVAARLVQETRGTPLATLVLQPGMIPSVAAPPVMPVFTLPRRAPRWAGSLYWRLVDLAGEWVVGATSTGSGPRSACSRSGASSSGGIRRTSSSGCFPTFLGRRSATGRRRSSWPAFRCTTASPAATFRPRSCGSVAPPIRRSHSRSARE